ncbi:MAG: CDP-diacylglycerol--glycerol-3-phosphate 3-phosphatidyltransferase [Acidiferrobacterales bacterium]|nr:CDP-diacylglycerol--glycerol-3-phosphate 3-phosphatidyltransferase [Acidiferrobacterales bacterium]
MILTLPNILTFARIVAIPIFVGAYFLSSDGSNNVVVIVFVLAAVTDWLDGFLARILKKTSTFGAFLDPVADKLMVCTALVLLVSDHQLADELMFNVVFVVSILIIVGREVSVVALREWMAELGNRASVATSYLSKGKTMMQMIAIVLLLYGQPVGEFQTLIAGELLLYVAATLTIWTMTIYLRAAVPTLMSTDRDTGSESDLPD